MKIAICTPLHGDPKAGYTKSLADMLIYSAQHGLTNIAYMTYSGSTLDTNRNALFSQASRWGASHILWIDADHTFPPHTLLRLLEIGKEVVGVNFLRREQARRPTVATDFEDLGKLVYSTKELGEARAVQRIVKMGLGICLVDMSIIARLPKEAFPPFQFTKQSGEDVHFFRSLAAAGIPAFVDHMLSMECGHIHEQVLRF